MYGFTLNRAGTEICKLSGESEISDDGLVFFFRKVNMPINDSKLNMY